MDTLLPVADTTTALRGRTALVTGATSELGRAISVALARSGANVVAHYRRSGAQAEELVEKLRGLGVEAWAAGADLALPGAATALAAEVARLGGTVSLLVNSASDFARCTLDELSAEELGEALQLGALSPLALTRALLGALPAGTDLRVVNLTDAYAEGAQSSHVAYNLSKRALLSLTRLMALQFAPRATVNAVAPGLVSAGPQEAGQVAALAARLPLGRMGTAGEVAQAVVWLLGAGYVTGQVLAVDGGASLVTPQV